MVHEVASCSPHSSRQCLRIRYGVYRPGDASRPTARAKASSGATIGGSRSVSSRRHMLCTSRRAARRTLCPTTRFTIAAMSSKSGTSFEFSGKAQRLRGFDAPTVWGEFSPLAVKHNAINLGQATLRTISFLIMMISHPINHRPHCATLHCIQCRTMCCLKGFPDWSPPPFVREAMVTTVNESGPSLVLSHA